MGLLTPTPAPLGSLDTLPRSHSLLQAKIAVIPSKRTGLENPTEKYGDCEQSRRLRAIIFTWGDLHRLQRLTWLVERTKDEQQNNDQPSKTMQLQVIRVQ